MTLGEKQRLFGRLFGELLVHIYLRGYECSLDWGYRPPEVAKYYASIGVGISDSLHILKLAHDINLFKDGKYLPSSEAHKPIGEWWEQQHELTRWGGRFGDGGHYSLEHEGRK